MGGYASRFDWGAASHPGRHRLENEDAFLAHPAAGLWAVADGMGGHASGRLAATTVIDALRGVAAPVSAAGLLADCEARIVAANARLHALGCAEGRTIGTTLAALLCFGDDYACIWSGDSRIYRVREGAIAQLSRDHSEVQDLVERGLLSRDEAWASPRRNVITRAIGIAPRPELEIGQGSLRPGDGLVLCSDGLVAHVEDAAIRDLVGAHPPQAAADALIALALERGGSDNVTVVVARLGEAPR